MGLDQFWLDAFQDAGVELYITPSAVYVGRDSALKFVEWLHGKKRILGFEGFAYVGDSFTTLSECIADLSDSTGEDAYKHSKNILQTDDFNKAQFIEFTLED
jgi:hypothetical protein